MELGRSSRGLTRRRRTLGAIKCSRNFEVKRKLDITTPHRTFRNVENLFASIVYLLKKHIYIKLVP
jgi:hypothetical protein